MNDTATTTYKIYTSKTSDNAADAAYSNITPSKVITTTPDISGSRYEGDAALDWSMSGQATSGLTDGNYRLRVEVRDITGSTRVKTQYLYIDNTAPTLTVTQPTASQTVKGDLFTISGTASDAAGGGFSGNCVNIRIYDGVTLKREWNVGLSGPNWSQGWTLAPDMTDNFFVAQNRIVRVKLTDKAGNTHQVADITVTKGAPPSWPIFTANGSSSAFNNATFKSVYSSSVGAGDDLFMIKGTNSDFTTRIDDGVAFTDTNLIVKGYRQSDGVLVDKDNLGALATKKLNPNTGTQVGQSSTYSYASLPDGEYSYRVQLYQAAAEINMQKYFIVDNTRPNLWVKKIESVDYVKDGSTKLGHIDMNEDFSASGYTTGTDGETNITGADMVSGVVKFYIKVKDNYRLKNIKVKMTDFNFGSGSGADFTLASRDGTDNWTIASQRGTMGSGVASVDYMKVTKVAETLEKNIDYIYLTLEFNTAYLTNVAGLNKHIEFVAEDWVGNLTDYTGGSYQKNTGTYISTNFDTAVNKDVALSLNNAKRVKFVLDVVPYISRITTSLDSAFSSKPSVFNRSALGWYPVRENEIINIYGFNFNGASTVADIGGNLPATSLLNNVTYNSKQYRIVSVGTTNFTTLGAASNTVGLVFTKNMTAGSGTGVVNAVLSVTNVVTNTQIRADLGVHSVSGELTLRVNNILSTNNYNSNSIVENQEPNSINNDNLNDDRSLSVWKSSDVVTIGYKIPKYESIKWCWTRGWLYL